MEVAVRSSVYFLVDYDGMRRGSVIPEVVDLEVGSAAVAVAETAVEAEVEVECYYVAAASTDGSH